MRLNRLELLRYGRFQDTEIAFPARAADSPDVTVIFGPNEAGKSTAFSGLLELLFGFKSGKHPYDFRFDRADLLVGAELELPGRGTTIVRRNSKRKQSLLDADGRPINEAILSGALHGLTSDTYEERFSLNETGLREGGQRIATAQGDLGQLLHAGLSGLTGMAAIFDVLAERSDTFYKKRGRGTALKIGTDRLKKIRSELRTERLTPDRERSLQQDYVKASKSFDAEDAELSKTRLKQAAAKAAQLWYEQTETIQQLDEALAEFPDGPDLAHDAAENVAGLVATIFSDTQQSQDETLEINKQEQIIVDNPVDALALPLKTEIARLEQLSIDGIKVMHRATTARADYARLSEERKTLSEEINSLLQHLQVPDTKASTIALVSVDLDQLDEAVRNCLTARNLKDAAGRQADSTRAQLGEAPEEPKDLTALRSAFKEWEAVKDLSILEAEQNRCSAHLTTVTASLTANWKELIAYGIPARETIDQVVQSWSKQTVEHQAARKALNTCSAELVSVKVELAALESAPDSVGIVEVEESRRKRDLEWQQHRVHLSIETADQFEETMYADDNNRAHYLIGTEARQRLLESQKNVRAIEAQYKNENTSYVELDEKYGHLSERCAAMAAKLGLEEDAPPMSFNQRYQDLVAAAQAAAELTNAQAALNSQLDRHKSASEVLIGSASLLQIDMTEGDQFVQIQRLLFMENNERESWEKWQKDEQVIAKLDEELELCQSRYREAQGKLQQLTVALPISDLSPEKIQAELPQLRRLQQLHGEQQNLSVQVDTLKQITTALTDAAKRLNHILGSSLEDETIDPLLVIDTTRERLDASERADKTRIDAINLRDKADKKSTALIAGLATAQTKLTAFFEGQGFPGLESRERIAKLAERDRLRALILTADKERKKARDGADQNLFTEELSKQPDATREAELEQELRDAQDLRDTARDAKMEAERLHREACDAAAPIDLVTEEATLLEGLRNDARQAAIARLGVLAARGALRQLAKERRSDMLRDVASAFVSMTTPAWKDVDVWSDTEGDKLVGIRNDGRSVPVENMSTGTMGQLYFALRLAGYQSFARDPGPLPMILDDIMETFDDTRARAALELCGQIGKTGQAILFTHHAHLVELARECIEGVAVVDIPE